jgi:hypothetical protein
VFDSLGESSIRLAIISDMLLSPLDGLPLFMSTASAVAVNSEIMSYIFVSKNGTNSLYRAVYSLYLESIFNNFYEKNLK